MTVDEVIAELDDNSSIAESYVLVREIKMYLELDHDHYQPSVKLKVWKSSSGPEPFQVEASRLVQTPTQGDPYRTSRPWAASEEEAIAAAIRSMVLFLKGAIREGHEPSESWLVPNPDY